MPYSSTRVFVSEYRFVPSPSRSPSIVQPRAASVVGKRSKVEKYLSSAGSAGTALRITQNVFLSYEGSIFSQKFESIVMWSPQMTIVVFS